MRSYKEIAFRRDGGFQSLQALFYSDLDKMKTKETALAYPIRLMQCIASLSGLLHDIGKANEAFQNVLVSNDKKHEEYRHEAVSVMMLSWLAPYSTDEAWITALLHAIEEKTLDRQIKQALEKEVKKQRSLLQSDNECEPVFTGCSATDCRQKPLLFSLLWMIVAHHHLPDGEAQNETACMTTTHHRRKGANVSKLSVTKLAAKGLPWTEDAWLKRFQSDLESLLLLIKEEGYQEELPHLFDHVRLFARPLFQMADHWMSSIAKAQTRPIEGYAYANSIRNPGEPIALGQKLHTHSLGVARYTHTVVHELLNLREALPSIEPAKTPEMLTKGSSKPEFQWQDQSAGAIKKECNNENTNAFFGLIMSGTGSGKTIGALKMLAAFEKDMRVVYASPLRSLTLQSGVAFENIGFTKNQLSTIIGDALVQKIFYATKEKTESPISIAQETSGDECDESDTAELEFSQPSDSYLYLRETFHSLKSIKEKALRMVGSPVLAATLDTVMKLADTRRGSYLSHFLRIATSDLIIDEVDSYSTVDLLAIGRLIEACGFWRNRVFLSSATLSPINAQAFYKMYLDGLKLRNALDGNNIEVSTGWFSNLVSPAIATNLGFEDFKQHHQTFAQSIAQELARAAPKRKVRNYYVRDDLSRPEYLQNPPQDNPQRILQYVNDIHDATAFTLQDGRSFSFGCIQVVNVKSCQDLVINLCKHHAMRDSSDVDYRVICLHGRLSIASRNYIENRLNVMLQRGGSEGDFAPLKEANVQAFIKTSEAKKLCIILVSTLETTGRDHDFDWGLIESRSERDIIQFVGRIRRHRQPLAGEATRNLIIFNEPFSWSGKPWSAASHHHPFSFFGVADPIGQDFKEVSFKAIHSPLLAKTHGELPTYREMMQLTYTVEHPVITPSRVLTDENLAELDAKKEFHAKKKIAYTVRACEAARLQYALLDARVNRAESLVEWRQESNKSGRLLATHAKKYRFRSGQEMQYYWYQPNASGQASWFHLSPSKKSNPQGLLAKLDFDDSALLFHFSEIEEIKALMDITGIRDIRGWEHLSGVSTRENVMQFQSCRYHYQLGLIPKKKLKKP